jgi:large subunit ribosomal protein L12
MEYVYAAVLLHKAGKDITEDSVKKVLTAAGVKVDDARVKSLVAALDGVDIEEAINTAAAAPVAAAPAAQEASSDDKKEDKKEEKKEDKKEESNAAAGLGSLFG